MNRLRIGAPRAAATALLASMIAVAPALGIAAPAARPHVIATVNVGDGPSGIGVNPRTNRAYVADFRANQVSVIDGSTNLVIATIDVGSGPAAVGVNPRTNRIYVARQGGGGAVIDGSRKTLFTAIPLENMPDGGGVVSWTHSIYVAR